MRRWMLGGFVTLALLTGACSDGDEEADKDRDEEPASGTRDEYVEAFLPGVAQIGGDEQQTQCAAEATVDTIGVDELNDVTSPDKVSETGTFDTVSMGIELDEETGNALYDAIDGCVDLYELMMSQTGSPEVADCLRSKVPEEMVREMLVGVFTSAEQISGDAEAALTTAYTECAPTTTLPAGAPGDTTPTSAP